jgi:hypothetical protein
LLQLVQEDGCFLSEFGISKDEFDKAIVFATDIGAKVEAREKEEIDTCVKDVEEAATAFEAHVDKIPDLSKEEQEFMAFLTSKMTGTGKLNSLMFEATSKLAHLKKVTDKLGYPDYVESNKDMKALSENIDSLCECSKASVCLFALVAILRHPDIAKPRNTDDRNKLGDLHKAALSTKDYYPEELQEEVAVILGIDKGNGNGQQEGKKKRGRPFVQHEEDAEAGSDGRQGLRRTNQKSSSLVDALY